MLAVVPAATVQFDCFHRDLNAGGKTWRSQLCQLSAPCCTPGEAARNISHTVTLKHKDIHTLEHATKHSEPNKCTRAYINKNTCLHALFVVSVSHSATYFCMQQWSRPRSSMPVIITYQMDTFPLKKAERTQWNHLCINCPLCGLVWQQETTCRFYGIGLFIETAEAVWMRLLVWDCLICAALVEVKSGGKSSLLFRLTT